MKMKIEEVTSLQHQQRVASHSHIKGLGLMPDGSAKEIHMGMVRPFPRILNKVWFLNQPI